MSREELYMHLVKVVDKYIQKGSTDDIEFISHLHNATDCLLGVLMIKIIQRVVLEFSDPKESKEEIKEAVSLYFGEGINQLFDSGFDLVEEGLGRARELSEEINNVLKFNEKSTT
jgi:hypothetical protein